MTWCKITSCQRRKCQILSPQTSSAGMTSFSALPVASVLCSLVLHWAQSVTNDILITEVGTKHPGPFLGAQSVLVNNFCLTGQDVNTEITDLQESRSAKLEEVHWAYKSGQPICFGDHILEMLPHKCPGLVCAATTHLSRFITSNKWSSCQMLTWDSKESVTGNMWEAMNWEHRE